MAPAACVPSNPEVFVNSSKAIISGTLPELPSTKGNAGALLHTDSSIGCTAQCLVMLPLVVWRWAILVFTILRVRRPYLSRDDLHCNESVLTRVKHRGQVITVQKLKRFGFLRTHRWEYSCDWVHCFTGRPPAKLEEVGATCWLRYAPVYPLLRGRAQRTGGYSDVRSYGCFQTSRGTLREPW